MLQHSFKSVFSGMFRKCLKIPALQTGDAVRYANDLMDILDREKSIDIDTGPEKRDTVFSTDYLFSNARGQMFGILVCINSRGDAVILRAFSGQYNSRWTAPGWVPPVIDPDEFDCAVTEKDKEIKKLDREIEKLESAAGRASEEDQKGVYEKIKFVKGIRKKISQDLMKELHSMYYLHNFNGEKKLMGSVFQRNNKSGRIDRNAPEVHCPEDQPGQKAAMPAEKNMEAPRAADAALGPPVPEGINMPSVPAMPAGTGDCCAPKLLNFAAKEGLVPISMTEFYYGKENKSGTRKHKHFYPPCSDKCEPIMGFLLSGVKELQEKYSDLIKSAEF